RVNIFDLHDAGDAKRLEPALAQPLVPGRHLGRLVLLLLFRAPRALRARGPVAGAEARGELGPALLEPLPQLGVLREETPRKVSAVGDVAPFIALGELQARLKAGQ